MKKSTSLLSLLLITCMLLSSCSIFGGNFGGGGNGGGKIDAKPLPDGAFADGIRQGVIGSIVQTGDGTAFVMGSVPAPRAKAVSTSKSSSDDNSHLVTMEHNFGLSCCVSGYIGKSLYVIQDFGSLAWNKKGIGHKDGTVILEYGENGYFSISSFNNDMIIVGNPTDPSVESLWDFNDSYMFGYLKYNEKTREFTPMYSENNLRFYTAGYFINGVAMVSVKQGDKVLFGIIDENGNYIVEPKYEMMSDESIDDVVIVALNVETKAQNPLLPDLLSDPVGRNIVYDSTIMTNVQGTRHYECMSQTVGLINTLTGETILPCEYAYAERVMDNTYFLVDTEGKKFLYDAKTNSFSDVNEGCYTYFNSEWMLYVVDGMTSYFADKELNLYETTGIDVADLTTNTNYLVNNLLNINVISAQRDASARKASGGSLINTGVHAEYNPDLSLYESITITETGDVINNVKSFTYPYNGGVLYTVENSLYRYDITTRTSTLIETGYGNFTEDYEGWNLSFDAEVYTLDEGVFVVRYYTYMEDGRSYHMIIVNDMGEVLFETSVNDITPLSKNYLGKYDDALYELAGSTNIEDNYFLTKTDGSHYLLQFVRGNQDAGSEDGDPRLDTTRTVDDFDTIRMLSPFMLDFKDGSNITVLIDGQTVSPDYYVYNSKAQSLKLLLGAIDHLSLINNGFVEIVVKAGNETQTLKIELSPLSTVYNNYYE